MNKKTSANKKMGGIPANALIIPIVAAVFAIHLVIIVLIMAINRSSSNLSRLMQDTGNYTSEATSLLAGSSLLSETSSNFVLMPLTSDGRFNTLPMAAYSAEIAADERRGAAIIADFSEYEIEPAAFKMLTDAAASADFMIENQLHAFALVCSVYTMPEIPAFDAVRSKLPELSAEDDALSNDEKLALAKSLLLSEEYSLNKQSVSQNVNACVGIIKADSGQASAENAQKIAKLRALLWVFTALVIIILVVGFVMIYNIVIKPLDRFVSLISKDDTLSESKGLQEVRLVAYAYNNLLKRRNSLEAILRSAAETDSLTGMPNRYSYEKFLLDKEGDNGSLALILFDVNYLKRTNDNYGHAAGDKLLKSAGECIVRNFGCFDECCCSRFGGDEFAAAIKNISRDEIEKKVEEFKADQIKRGISISWGYAYTENSDGVNLKALMEEADKAMYDQKKFMHDHYSDDHKKIDL